MGEFSSAVVSVLRSLAKRATVQGQGGLLTGQDPAQYNPNDPLRIWIIQLGVIILMAQVLGFILGKIRQPRVIAEILGGILLGPSVFGRIPGFTNHIFPANSVPYLSLTANIGLCLYLFIIGLEIDLGLIRRNVRVSVAVAIAGVVIPFGIGCGVSSILFHHFINPTIKYNYFMLFIGVSYSITAFPVLCRILSALKLLETTVGLIVLSAGVANDVIGWSLLALAVAFVNATSGLTALWTFLTCMAFTLILLFPVKWALLWFARKTGSTVHGPSMSFMTVVMLILWGAAFFTDIIGVNAIFGAFVAGAIVPREGGITIAFMEKLEDIVHVLFIPLYFTISGLNTNLGLIKGNAWGFVFVIAILDFSGKFIGCTTSSRLLGFTWREATTVGSLMTCKGLVELIVLNVGLNAGILTREVFSMFVLEALIITFMTTPLVLLIYPPRLRTFGLGGGISHTASPNDSMKDKYLDPDAGEDEGLRHRLVVVLDDFKHVPGIMALTKLVVPATPEDGSSNLVVKPTVNALRLIELSDRTSTFMRSVTEALINADPLVSVFKMFGEQSDLSVSTSLSVVPQNDWAHAVATYAERHASQLVLIPWVPHSRASAADHHEHSRGAKTDTNPFDIFFGPSARDNSAATLYSHFVRGVFRHCKTDVALFVDLGDNAGTNGQQHIFFPFFGGLDDRTALDFVVQLCMNSRISATVIRVARPAERVVVNKPEAAIVEEKAELGTGTPVTLSLAFPNTIYGQADTTYMLQSQTADDLAWSRYASPAAYKDAPAHLRSALSRMVFSDLSNPLPLHALLERTKELRETHRRVIVVVGRSKRFVHDGIRDEVKELLETYKCGNGEMVRSTVGEVGTAFVTGTGISNGVVVVRAAGASGTV